MSREKRSLPGAAAIKLEDGETAVHAYDKRPVSVTVYPGALECDVCYGPLTPPLFQCVRGHLTCSSCTGENGYECAWCHQQETTFRCRVMEHLLAGLNVPCEFKHKGCAAMVPYGDKKSHGSSCFYAPCYCPIDGCASRYSGVTLLGHLEHNHPEIGRTHVKAAVVSSLMMCEGEPARLMYLTLDDGGAAVFLLVVDQGKMPAGRALWVVRLKLEMVKEEPEQKKEFRYKIMVSGKAGILSLSGEPEAIGRLTAPYKASSFLFVPDVMLDDHPDHDQGLAVLAELN